VRTHVIGHVYGVTSRLRTAICTVPAA